MLGGGEARNPDDGPAVEWPYDTGAIALSFDRMVCIYWTWMTLVLFPISIFVCSPVVCLSQRERNKEKANQYRIRLLSDGIYLNRRDAGGAYAQAKGRAAAFFKFIPYKSITQVEVGEYKTRSLCDTGSTVFYRTSDITPATVTLRCGGKESATHTKASHPGCCAYNPDLVSVLVVAGGVPIEIPGVVDPRALLSVLRYASQAGTLDVSRGLDGVKRDAGHQDGRVAGPSTSAVTTEPSHVADAPPPLYNAPVDATDRTPSSSAKGEKPTVTTTTTETERLRRENEALRAQVEQQKLREENERLKRTLNQP